MTAKTNFKSEANLVDIKPNENKVPSPSMIQIAEDSWIHISTLQGLRTYHAEVAPFGEMKFAEILVNGTWVKTYLPYAQNAITILGVTVNDLEVPAIKKNRSNL